MSKFMENVKTINSVTRTGIFLVTSVVVGYLGFAGYKHYIEPGLEAKQAKEELEELQLVLANQQQEIASARKEIEQTQAENGRLKVSMQLMKIDRRMGKVKVLASSVNDAGEPIMNVRFTEYNELGDQIGASRDFELRGNNMYIDCWVVKFGDKYVEENDALRSASLCVFKGIYGNLDGPEGSQSLDSDSIDEFPVVYGQQRKTDFEQQIWSDFWELANDSESQEDYGIRAIHGQANYLRVKEGQTYEVTVRSSGAASLHPIDD